MYKGLIEPDDVLSGRLLNWKFGSATRYLAKQPDAICTIVNALATKYGNLGWQDGTEADFISDIVTALIGSTCEDQGEEDHAEVHH